MWGVGQYLYFYKRTETGYGTGWEKERGGDWSETVLFMIRFLCNCLCAEIFLKEIGRVRQAGRIHLENRSQWMNSLWVVVTVKYPFLCLFIRFQNNLSIIILFVKPLKSSICVNVFKSSSFAEFFSGISQC